MKYDRDGFFVFSICIFADPTTLTFRFTSVMFSPDFRNERRRHTGLDNNNRGVLRGRDFRHLGSDNLQNQTTPERRAKRRHRCRRYGDDRRRGGARDGHANAISGHELAAQQRQRYRGQHQS